MSFQDQTIVITGASMGIGRALAIALAACGANLALAARSAEALAETVQLCEAAGGTALAVPTDITEPTACQALIQQTIQTFGRLDCLVNNAALSMIALFEEVQDLSAPRAGERLEHPAPLRPIPRKRGARGAGRRDWRMRATGRLKIPTLTAY